jgi:hypothetical protein
MSSPIQDDDADKPIMPASPWTGDEERQDETLRLQEEVIAAAQKLERQSIERESWVSREQETRERESREREARERASRELASRELESRGLPQGLAFLERTPLQLESARPRFEIAKLQSENRFSLQESPRGLWAPTLDPISMPQPPQDKFGLPSPGVVIGMVGAVGAAAAIALVVVHTLQFAPESPSFSAQSGSGKNRSFAAVADNLPRIATAETKLQTAELAATAAASVVATVPTSEIALAKPSVMAPPPSPPVEAMAARVEPAQPEPAKPSVSIIPEPRPADNLSRDEIIALLKRGQDLVAGGDLASGRLMLTRAALAGSADASLALAGTFDAAVLANLKAIGVQPDPAKARAWYMRAAEQGSAEAKRRLQQSATR